MARPTALKDHFRETRLFTNRAIVALTVTVLSMLALVARLIDLQIVDHMHYSGLSEQNRVHIRAVPPTRGLIFDRNGVLLAENLPSHSLEVIPERVEDMDATLAALQELVEINDEDLGLFRKRLAVTHDFKAIPLRTRLSDEEVARFAVDRHRFPGVDIVARLYRHYPQGNLAVHAVGYVGRINEQELQQIDAPNYEGTDYVGKTGVEKYYEDILHGEVGVEQVETNAQGRALRVLERVPPVPGLNLHLSLDAEMQRVAEGGFAGERGALVAIDPTDGSILALASMPGFDPNLFVGGIDNAAYDALQNSRDQPLFNRALRGRYPPGSTIKPFVGLAGLEYGVINPDVTTYCPGWYTLQGDEDHKYRDWKKGGHGRVNLDTAIVQSCDVYFYDLALTLGIDRLTNFLEPFGFNDLTGVDISGELAGLVPSRDWKRRTRREAWYPGETLITGIGQGFTLATPLGLAAATATLSSYGQHLRPRIVAATQDPNTNEVVRFAAIPNVAVPTVRRSNWEYIIRAMTRVVHSPQGTAHRIAQGAHYTIAGKTGTAQVFGVKQEEEYKAEEVQKHLRDHALFISFAPVEEPRIAVAVIVENGGHGSSAASPMARRVMDQYLDKLLPPEGTP